MTTTELLPLGGAITHKERSHLRALIRGHFKLLKQEIAAEENRALAEVDTRIAEFHTANRKTAEAFHVEMHKIIDAANAKIRDLVRDHPEMFGPGGKWAEPSPLHKNRAYRRDDDERALRRAMIAQIRSRASTARTQVERQENDALRNILLDALETQAAYGIVAQLPAREDVFSVDLQAITAEGTDGTS